MREYSIDTEFDNKNKFIVENVIASRSISLIVASPKKGKTALGLNLAVCINEGISFLEQEVLKSKVVYYCNELSGSVIQERIHKMDLPCSTDLKFYEGTSYVNFKEFKNMVRENALLGYKVFIVDTFSKIKYDRDYNPNNYNDTYSVMSQYYQMVEEFGVTFIMMYHTKKDNSVRSVSEKVIGSQALSGSVDTIIAIDKGTEFDTEFRLNITSRLFESTIFDVKLNEKRKILELEKIDPIESLEPSIQKLVQSMPRLKELKGTIVDIASKINLDIESPQQFGKTLKRNGDILKKYGIGISVKRHSKGKTYALTYNADDVEF